MRWKNLWFLNMSSFRGKCFCCRITIWFFKTWEIVVFENSKPYLIQLIFSNIKKVSFLKWIILKICTSLWNKMLLMSYIVLLTGVPGWPEQDTESVGQGFTSPRGWLALTRCRGSCESTLAPRAGLPRVELVTQHYRTDRLFLNSSM